MVTWRRPVWCPDGSTGPLSKGRRWAGVEGSSGGWEIGDVVGGGSVRRDGDRGREGRVQGARLGPADILLSPVRSMSLLPLAVRCKRADCHRKYGAQTKGQP